MAQCEDVKTSRLSIGCKVVLIMRFHHHIEQKIKETVVRGRMLCLSRAGAGTEAGLANTGGKRAQIWT